MRILLVEDNEDLAQAVQEFFTLEGHAIDWLSSAEQAEKVIGHEPFDLLIFDVNLPGKSGFDFLRQYRASQGKLPIMVLTARSAVDDRIDALEMGADDYLVKPFDFRELHARCRALLRRERGQAANDIKLGNLSFNASAGTASIDGQAIELRAKEIQLLELFARRLDRIITREEIVAQTYSFDGNPSLNAIEQQVARLRKKLEGSSLIIKTVRGMGYLAHVRD